MSQQGPVAVNSYADTAGGSVTWDTSSGNSGTITDIGTGSPVVTDVLTCTFNAGDFTIPMLGNRIASITIFFDADGTTDMGGPTPTITSVKISLGINNLADGASLPGTFSTFSYGGTLWGDSSISPAAVNGSWTIQIQLTDHGAGGEQTTATIKNVKATVVYEVVDAYIPGGFPDDSIVSLRRAPHFLIPPIESIDPKVLMLSNEPEPLHSENYPMAFFARNPQPSRRPWLQHMMGDYDPVMLTLANAPEPSHPENYPMAFVPRAPRPQRRAYQQLLMGEYDPTMFLFGNEPEPLHPENYPPMALLPYPRPQRAAWDFPIMTSTDYTGLLSGESAHPETTRQACADLPRRNWPRQYQPPMESIDPGALSAREEPSAGDLPLMSQPIHRRPRVQPPTIEATSYVWTTPGDQSQIRIDPMGGPLPQQRHCTFAGETVLLDAWSSQQVEQLLAEPMIQPRRVQPPRLESVAITPQYFQDTQIIAWLPPLSLPVHATPRLADQRNQGELAGETVPLAIDPTTTGQFLLPSMGRPRTPGAVRPRPNEPGAETMQQPAVPTYQLVDYDPRGQQPLPPRWRVQPSDIGELTIDTSRFAQPLAEFPPLAQPVRPAAQPMRQSDLAPAYSEATNAVADSIGFMGIGQEMPLAARARQAHSAQPITPADLEKSFFVEPMYAPQRHFAPPQQKSTEILVDQQYFPVPSPDGYQAQWFVPIPPRRMQPVPIETASTTVFMVGGNPATFVGSGAFVVVAGAVYSLAPTAGKVVRGSKGL